jgi:major membrane immunogen (membrane-anchored lipoprotein)
VEEHSILRYIIIEEIKQTFRKQEQNFKGMKPSQIPYSLSIIYSDLQGPFKKFKQLAQALFEKQIPI